MTVRDTLTGTSEYNKLPSLILASSCGNTNFTIANMDILGTKGIYCAPKFYIYIYKTLDDVKSLGVAWMDRLGADLSQLQKKALTESD